LREARASQVSINCYQLFCSPKSPLTSPVQCLKRGEQPQDFYIAKSTINSRSVSLAPPIRHRSGRCRCFRADARRLEGCGNEESLPYMILSAPHRDAATAGAVEKLAFLQSFGIWSGAFQTSALFVMPYEPIENYGVIGDLQTVALVGMSGSNRFHV